MPDVARGFTHDRDPGGVPRDAERTKIRQQLEASHGVAGDGVVASADEIKRSMLAAEGWRANISTGDPDENAREQAQIEQFAGEGQRLLARDAERDAKLAQYERQPVIEDAQAAFLGLGYESNEAIVLGQAFHWHELTAEERAQFVADGYVDEDDVPSLDAAALEARGLLRHAAREDAELRARVTNNVARARVFGQLLDQRGLVHGTPEATQWWDATAGRAAAEGIDVLQGSAADFTANMLAAETANEEDLRAHREAAWKAELFATPTSTDIGSGLTINNGFGHVPLQPVPEIYVKPNYPLAAQRKFGNSTDSAQAIRAAVGGDADAMTREHRALQSQAGKLFEAARANTGR